MYHAALKITFAVLVLAAATTGTRAEPAALFGAINDRLSYMQAVAAWKADNNRPVEDLDREKIVLDAARTKATEIGLSGDSAGAFFQAQINAAKEIQTCWIRRWKKGAPRPAKVPDLVEEVRPALLRLGGEILELMAAEPVGAADRQAFTTTLTVDCLSQYARHALFDGLLAVNSE